MNPYTSLWSGVHEGDGPQEFHLVLLDNGRTQVLADTFGAPDAAVHPLLGLPERLPGLRAHRRPRLRLGLPRPDRRDPLARSSSGSSARGTLPWASTLCGACYEVCPVKIDIPAVLVHLRGQAVDARAQDRAGRGGGGDAAAAWAFATRARFERAQRLARVGQWPLARGRGRIERLPRPCRPGRAPAT